MNKLEEAREIINDVDKKMIDLFKKRMHASEMVADFKQENSLPVLDSKREDLIIKKNLEMLDDCDLEEYYIKFIKNVMNISKDYQKKRMEK